MAFLLPAAGAAATTSLGTGLALGSTIGLKAGIGSSLLAPTLGSTLTSGSLLTGAGGSLLGGGGGSLLAGGAGLGGLGGAGGLLGGSSALLPQFASLGGAGGLGGSLLGGGGGSLLAGGAGGLGGLTPGASALLPKFSSLTGTGGLGVIKPGVDLAAVGSKTLNPGQIEYLKAASASTRPDLVSQNFLPGPTDYVKELVAGKTSNLFPNAVEAPTKLLGEGITKIPTTPAGTLRMPLDLNAPTTGLKVTPIGPETPITEGALSISKFPPPTIDPSKNFLSNLGSLIKNPSMDAAGDYVKEHPYATAAAAYGLYSLMKPKYKAPEEDKGMIRPYEFAYNPNTEAYAVSPTADSREQVYFNPVFTPREPTKAAEGGLMGMAVGGPVEQMAALNSVGANTGYPMAQLQTPLYSNPAVQRPEAVNVISPSAEPAVGMYSGEQKFAEGGDTRTKEKTTEPPYAYTYDPKTLQFTQTAGPGGTRSTGGIGALVGGQGAAPVATSAAYPALSIPAYQTPEQQLGLADFYAMMDRRLGAMGGYAAGGDVYDLGSYSDGGRLLRGPGDGVSDSIPAVIGNKQPARLADGEFVVPARIVSELGNGSTEAGARKLYAMMDRVQKARRKTVGKDRVAANTRADKHLPA